MYNTFGANVVQASEGTVGTGITATVGTTTATIGEYADYANISSLAIATSLDNAVDNIGRELSYRLGQTLSAIVRAVIDGSNSVDSSVATAIAGGTSITLANIRSAVQSLAGRAVMPFDESENLFAGVIHPFAVGDILNDSSNNGVVDILKRVPAGQQQLEDLVSTDLKETLEFPASGVSFFQSNLVTLSSTYKSSSGVVAYRTYIMGKDGVIGVRLGGRGDNSINDGNWRNIDVTTVTNPSNSAADPSGLIGGWTSYRKLNAV